MIEASRVIEASRGRRHYVMAMLIVIYLFNMLDRHIMYILAEPIRRDLHISDTQYGILTGIAFALFYTSFGIPAGWLADRFGRTKVIALACTLWSICSTAGSLAGSFVTLALSRMGVGVGDAGGTAPSYSLIADYFPPKERGQALGLFHSGSAIALLIAGSFGGWVAATWGWRWALAVVSLPGMLFALLLYLTVPEPKRPPGEREEPRPLGPAIRAFLADPLLRTASLGAGMVAITTFGLLAWMPSFLMRAKGMTLGEVAVWYGPASALGNGGGMWLGGWLADRFATRDRRAYALVPLAATLGAGLFVALAALAPGWQLAMALLMIGFTLANFFLPPLLVVIHDACPAADRSLYSALFLLAMNLAGHGIGPVYVGMVSDRLHAQGAASPLAGGLAALVPMTVLAAVVHWRLAGRLARGGKDFA